MVKIKNFKKPPNTCAAFVEKFIGPFKILVKLSEVSYEIGAEGVKTQVVHYNRLLPFFCCGMQPFYRRKIYWFNRFKIISWVH
jgi:hypothetical protein